MQRTGPPRERYTHGPNCGDFKGRPPCLYREICTGYAPLESPTITYREADGTVHEEGVPGGDFLFIMEKIGPDEVALGRNAVGGTGRTVDRLLREQTPLRRNDITLANCVRCRPIAYDAHTECGGQGCAGCDKGQLPALNDRGDHIDIGASFDQIRECTSRYLDSTLEAFEGKYIVCLGRAAVYYMLGRAVQISKHHGTIFTPGQTKKCETCVGRKTLDGKLKKCSQCNGRGKLKCQCGGVTKHRKSCGEAFPDCLDCGTAGKVPGKRKRCPNCAGDGIVPVDPGNPHVCEKLKDHQLMMITYHPASASRNPAEIFPILERDFSRLTKMEEELEYADNAVYDEYPGEGYGISAEILGRARSEHRAVEGSVPELSKTGKLRFRKGVLGVGGAGEKRHTGKSPIAAGIHNLHPVGDGTSLTIDLETTGLDADSGRITHFAFTDRPNYGAVLHPSDPRCQELLLRYPTLVGQNIVLFDWWWLERQGYEIPSSTEIVDTRFLGKLINPDTPNDLPYLTSELADPPLRGYWKAKDDYRRHIERVACIDVDATTRVLRGAWNRLERTGQSGFVRNYIIPISRVVFEMRLAGMKIDKSRMEEAVGKIEAELKDLRAALPDWGGTGSEGQHAKVHEHLYQKLKLPVQKLRGKWTVTAGKPARETLLGLLATNDKKVKHLSEEEKAEAATFVELLDECWDTSLLKREFKQLRYRVGDFVHPELNPVHTATLRPGATRPAVLKVPSCKCKPACHGTEKHKCPGSSCPGTNPKCKNARWVFIPDHPDWEIMSVDLSQAEVIGFLWYAEQWDALDAILNRDQDAYQTIGNKIFGREATSGERDRTKVDTLAFIYGEAERTQSMRLRIPVDEIRERRSAYVSALPGVEDFRNQLISHAMRTGFVESPWGVRRYIRVESRRGRAANEACNAPIQNICPMVTGFAMIKLHAQLPKPARLWVPWVYDELNFVYPKEMRKEVYAAARDILGAPVSQMPASPIKMGSGLRFRLDFSCGKDWGHMIPYNP